MPISYEVALRTVAQTLPVWVDRAKNAINETVLQTFPVDALIIDKIKKDYTGGLTIQEKLQFTKANVGKWVAMDEKLALGGTRGPTWLSTAMRTMRSAHFIGGDELESQDRDDVIINNLERQAKEDVALFHISMIHDAMWAADGNYAHDGITDFLAPFGFRHLITLDGLHVTGSTTTAIQGINASTQSLYRNQFINPVTASDGGKPITSYTQIRTAFDRAFRMLHYGGVQGFGKLASKVTGVPDTQTVRKSMLSDDYIILADGKFHDDYGALVFDRMDNIGEDQGFPVRKYRGVPILWTEGLGMNSYGYGYDSAGNALWTDRGSSYASGKWAGYSEALVLYLPEWRFYVGSQSGPKEWPPYKPEGMDGIAYETKYRCQLSVRSRRRGGVYVGPFPGAAAA